MRLSNQKFIERALAKEAETQPSQRDAAIDVFSDLRGIGQDSVPAPGVALDPVSFVVPGTDQRRFGWLVPGGAVDNGLRAVMVDDGDYVLVPEDKVEHFGRRSREGMRAELRESLGLGDGLTHRADLRAAHDPRPAGTMNAVGGGDYQLLVQYDKGVGLPTDQELRRFLAVKWPSARFLDADASMPGRVAVMLHSASDLLAADTEYRRHPRQPGLHGEEAEGPSADAYAAGHGPMSTNEDSPHEYRMATEMGPAVGGEVIETLDPADLDASDDEDLAAPIALTPDAAGDARPAMHTAAGNEPLTGFDFFDVEDEPYVEPEFELKVGDTFKVDGRGQTWEVYRVNGVSLQLQKPSSTPSHRRKWFGASYLAHTGEIEIFEAEQGSGDKIRDLAHGKVTNIARGAVKEAASDGCASGVEVDAAGEKDVRKQYTKRDFEDLVDESEAETEDISAPVRRQLRDRERRIPVVQGIPLVMGEPLAPPKTSFGGEGVQQFESPVAPKAPKKAVVQSTRTLKEVVQAALRVAQNDTRMQQYITEAVSIYLQKGGVQALLQRQNLSTPDLVAQGILAAQNSDPSLYGKITKLVADNIDLMKAPEVQNIGKPDVDALLRAHGLDPSTVSDTLKAQYADLLRKMKSPGGQQGGQPNPNSQPNPDDNPFDTHRFSSRARTAAARQPTTLELSRIFQMPRVVQRGDYLVGTLVWDPEAVKTMSGAQVKQALISFFKMRASWSRDQAFDMGHIGKPRFLVFDAEGYAEIAVRSSNAHAFPLETTEADAKKPVYRRYARRWSGDDER